MARMLYANAGGGVESPLYERLARRAAKLFHPLEIGAAPLPAPEETCSTIELNAFHEHLARAPLSKAQKDRLATFQQTSFQHQKTSSGGHFLLKWDSTGRLAIPESIVDDAAADLEDAYTRYTADFGQPPSPNVVDVLFDNARTPQALLPAGPISLPADYMKANSGNRLARTVTATHELFHVLQGGFGYTSKAFTTWFLEGGATWSEAAYYNAIGGGLKLTSLFSKPLQKLRGLSYTALPFLIFLENFFYATKTGSYFMVDWMRSNLGRPADADPLLELDTIGPPQRADYGADRLLVQFALQMALRTWYKTATGIEAIPQFRDADGAGYPQIPYADQRVQLPGSNMFGFSSSLDPGIAVPISRLRQTEFFFYLVNASSAVSPYNVIGSFSAGQQKNPYVGAAVVNPHTRQPVAHHSQIAESTAPGDRHFTFGSDTEAAYFVTAGGSQGLTIFSLLVGPVVGP